MYRFLIIDDNNFDRTLLSRIIEKQVKDTEIISVGSLEEGLEVIKNNPLDMVFLDLHLGDKSGFEVLKYIRAGEHKDLSVILVSSFDNLSDKKTGLELGADDIIDKPIVNEDVMFRVDVQLKQKKIRADAALAAQRAHEGIQLLYKDLEQKNKELQMLDQLKADFVSTVSHELRTPLAISIEGISLILDGFVGDITEKQKNLLTSSKENLKRLNMIVNDLLDISKIEAGKVELHRIFFNIVDLLKESVDSYQPVVAKKNLSLVANLPSQEILLYVDKNKVTQVVANLLSNAYKFTPEGGHIEVGLALNDKEVVCSIKDSGVGIDEEYMPRLFQKFKQIGRQEGPGIKGTGLGLSISKSLVEMQGGRIWAESEVGCGTTFYFSLPLYAQVKHQFNRQFDDLINNARLNKISLGLIHVSLRNTETIKMKQGDEALTNIINKFLLSVLDIPMHPNDKVFLYDIDCLYIVLSEAKLQGVFSMINRVKRSMEKNHLSNKMNEAFLDIKFGIAIYPDSADSREGLVKAALDDISRKKTILLVDDDRQFFTTISPQLKKDGYHVNFALTGQEALTMMMENRPDLVILDIIMPGMNGYEVFGRMKQEVSLAPVPIIFLTSKNIDTVRSEAPQIGEVPVVSKTDNFAFLLDLINKTF